MPPAGLVAGGTPGAATVFSVVTAGVLDPDETGLDDVGPVRDGDAGALEFRPQPVSGRANTSTAVIDPMAFFMIRLPFRRVLDSRALLNCCPARANLWRRPIDPPSSCSCGMGHALVQDACFAVVHHLTSAYGWAIIARAVVLVIGGLLWCPGSRCPRGRMRRRIVAPG